LDVVLLRVDSRLVHGQVIEAWLPYLNTKVIVVVDDMTSRDKVLKEVMSMAVPLDVDLFFSTVRDLVFRRGDVGPVDKGALILCRDLKVALVIVKNVPGIMKVNLGNLQYASGKKEVSPSVFMDEKDKNIVREIKGLGVEVNVKTVPTDVEAHFTF
jgi:mannose/fructose/N-acetylgalactosamine-specific phosphotransferase system component IIB